MTEVDNKSAIGSHKDSDQGSFSLDAILIHIGQFGRFQILVHRCRVSECDGPTSGYEEAWTAFSIPRISGGNLDKCYRYVPYNRSTDMCFADNYDQHSKEDCGKDFIFRDNELTISNDFDIYCSDDWKLSMVGTICVAGQFVGTPVGGYFSDRYGRRTLVAIGGFLSAVLGIIRSFSPNYYVFIILGFFEHFCSGIIYATLFIFGLELVSLEARTLTCSVLTIFYSVGEIVLAILAKSVPNWRWILRIGYTPALAHIALLWFLPESVRWLLSRGDEKKAAEVLQNAAKTNKRKLSDLTIEKLFGENRYQLEKANKSQFPIKQAFKVFPWRIMNCALGWFLNALVYQGLSLNSILLGGNKYDNFMYLALAEIPANILLYFTMDRFGRRYSLFGYLVICGICLGATIFYSKDFYVFQLFMFLVGKIAITISIQVLTYFTVEIFPTNVRNSVLSFCATFGKIGSMMGPQTVLLAKYNESAPAILFSISALVGGSMALMFPETTNTVLPSTMDEAERIGQEKKEVE